MSDENLPKKRYTIPNFVKFVVRGRQVRKDQDTSCLVWGVPGSGKSTFCLHFMIAYIKLMKDLHKMGLTQWQPERNFSAHLRKYVVTSPEDANEMIVSLPFYSYKWTDEAIDITSWMTMLSKVQRDYIMSLQKSRDRKLFSLDNIPNMKLMNKSILARAHYLFLLMGEHDGKHNRAYIFRNYDDSIRRESIPFGYQNIEKDFLKNPYIDQDDTKLHNYMMRQPRCIGYITFGKIDDKIYNLYKKIIKDPQMVKTSGSKQKMVPYAELLKERHALRTVLYNLYNKDDKTYAQINNLLTDKWGRTLTSVPSIRAWVNNMALTEVPPDIDNKDIFEEALKSELMKLEIDPEEDIDFDDIVEKEESEATDNTD